MKTIYNISTFSGIVLLLLSIPVLVAHLLGHFVGLTFAMFMPLVIPMCYIGFGLMIAPAVHRKVYKVSG